MLPGGELPLELSSPSEISLFLHALRSSQLVGMVQPNSSNESNGIYDIGCAGRIRQYRERKDGRLNVMLTGICRFRITESSITDNNFRLATVDWSNYPKDYETEVVALDIFDEFKRNLHQYFKLHNMQVDWKTLENQPTEKVINNLILVLNLGTREKQQLLESSTVSQRTELFTQILKGSSKPTLVSEPHSQTIN